MGSQNGFSRRDQTEFKKVVSLYHRLATSKDLASLHSISGGTTRSRATTKLSKKSKLDYLKQANHLYFLARVFQE